MTGTSCTDDARVKVPLFQKVTFFYNIQYSTETISICISACLKMFLTTVIEVKQASDDLLYLDSSFLLCNSMKTKTTSSLIIEIQLYACNLHSKFAQFCTPYYLRHGIGIFSVHLLLLNVSVLVWKLQKCTFKLEVRSHSEMFVITKLTNQVLIC